MGALTACRMGCENVGRSYWECMHAYVHACTASCDVMCCAMCYALGRVVHLLLLTRHHVVHRSILQRLTRCTLLLLLKSSLASHHTTPSHSPGGRPSPPTPLHPTPPSTLY